MNLHAATEYLKYRWKARGRHGVHSPFVYRFVEHALRAGPQPAVARDCYWPDDETGGEKTALYLRLIRYFDIRQIIYDTGGDAQCIRIFDYDRRMFPDPEWTAATRRFLTAPGLAPFPEGPDLVHLSPRAGQPVTALWDKQLPLVHPALVVLIDDIHATPAATTAWNAIRASEKVRLSIDLYRAGLLLFREEFLEKQHFILRYPLK